MPLVSHWTVYILECADGTLYTGVTREMERRLAQHNGELAGGPKYTRGRRPVRLLWCAGAPDQSQALKREMGIKRLSRQDKLRVVRGEIA